MNIILKKALVYTGIYFLFCIAWLLILLGVQIFWKPVIFVFAVLVALFTLDYVRGTTIMRSYDILYTAMRAKFAS